MDAGWLGSCWLVATITGPRSRGRKKIGESCRRFAWLQPGSDSITSNISLAKLVTWPHPAAKRQEIWWSGWIVCWALAYTTSIKFHQYCVHLSFSLTHIHTHMCAHAHLRYVYRLWLTDAQLVRASSRCAKIEGLIPGQGTYKNQQMNV